MVYILPKRLLALVRPAFDLVLQRIQNLKRRPLDMRRRSSFVKGNPFSLFFGTPFFGTASRLHAAF